MTHDYKRNGTIDLFAAMNVATGEVLTAPAQGPHRRGRAARSSSRSTPPSRAAWRVHVVLDNLSAHTAPEITKWLAHKDRRRWHLHFTPTSSSWLNLIERWFKELTDKRLRRGAFTSVADLIDAITDLGRALERRPQAVHLESHRRRHHRQGQRGREPSTRSNRRRTTSEASPLTAESGAGLGGSVAHAVVMAEV